MGTGYTRNDTPNNIADGNVINASDLDGEFDSIQAAFNASTGHSHDGTTGEGPQIDTGGIANDAVTLGTKTSGNYVATGAVSGVGLSGSASSEGATFTITSNATSANTVSTIVARDASGNFSAGQITGTSFVSSGDMTFGDNDKAIFGAGSDLQIWHSGASSNIKDNGTGNLNISADELVFYNAATNEKKAEFTSNGAVDLYHDNSKKLATTATGVDVTGGVAADGLTVDGQTNLNGVVSITSTSGYANLEMGGPSGAFVDLKSPSSDDYDGRMIWNGSDLILTTSASSGGDVILQHQGSNTKLRTTATGVDVTGTVTADTLSLNSSTDFGIGTISSDTNWGMYLRSDNVGGSDPANADFNFASNANEHRLRIGPGGDISFYDSTGVTQGFYWDASTQRLGLGTTTPAQELHIVGKARVQRSTNANIEIVADNNTGANPFVVGSNSDTFYVKNQAASGFGTGGDVIRYTEGGSLQLMGVNYIDSSGNVGIGQGSPGAKLEVGGNALIRATTGSGTLSIVSSANVSNAGNKIAFFGANRFEADEEMAFIQPLLVGNNGGAGNVQSGHLTFGTSGTERLRIDSSGNVGIGTSSPSATLDVANSSGSSIIEINASNASASQLRFGDTDDSDIGLISYSHAINALQIYTNNSERMRIDSSGNVGIGTTSPSDALTVSTSAVNAGVTVSGSTDPQYFLNSSGGNQARFKINDATPMLQTGSWTNIPVGFYTNGTERMRISNTGIVTKPAQPAFRAVSTGSWTIPTSTFTIFPANSAVFNVGGGYNTGTYTFTAPVDGVYYFAGQWFGSVGSGRAIASIYKNGGQTGGSQSLSVGSTLSGGISYATECMMQLSAGDTASFYTYQESGGTVTANQTSHLSFWYGYLLG